MGDLSDRFKQALANDPNFKPMSEELNHTDLHKALDRAKSEKNDTATELYQQAYLRPGEAVKKEPVALSRGEYENGWTQSIDPLVIGTYGNFSAIIGPPKARKSFLKSALIAGYCGGESTNYFPNIKGHGTKKGNYFKHVLDIDTEQSRFHVQNTRKRIERMIGAPYPNLHSFSLRPYNSAERLKMVEEIIMNSTWSKSNGGNGLVFIDGIADLVNDTNDLKQANEMVDRLLKWTADKHIHICTVIHTAKDNAYATGHLGSAVSKKCETVMKLTPHSDGTTEVNFVNTRGRSPENFSFKIEKGLPVLEDNETHY